LKSKSIKNHEDKRQITMVQDPYGVLADDRINDELDWDEINSRGDYKEKVKEFLNNKPDMYGNFRGKNLTKNEWVLDAMYDESKAKEKVENKAKENLEALRKAQLLEAKRSKRSREADERRTHRKTREANKRTVAVWRRGKYRRMDIKSIDTKKRMRLNTSNLITRRDLRLKNIRVSIDKIGRKHFTSPITGRFVSDPFKR
jgi:hypothetical protein